MFNTMQIRSQYHPNRPVTELLAEGWYPADLHVHTLCSYDVVKAPWLHPEALYQKARSMGMKYITFTDHDTMNAYDMVGWQREGLVPGVEIKIKDSRQIGHTIHVNVYELNKKQFLELEAIARKKTCLETFLQYLRDHDLPFTYNHPFWFEAGETPNYKVIPHLIRTFPVVEYNMHRVRPKNALTLMLAEQFGKGVVATTDTHTGDLGKAFTLAKGETFRDFYEAIRRRESFIVPQDLTLKILTEEIEQWMELLFRSGLSRLQARIGTGIHQLDRGLDAVMKGALNNRPVLRAVCQGFGYAISWSRLPAFWYLQTQHLLASQIRRELRASGVAV
jgi:predicted metal-dependent phosphoesterase TrpH